MSRGFLRGVMGVSLDCLWGVFGVVVVSFFVVHLGCFGGVSRVSHCDFGLPEVEVPPGYP